MMVVRSSAVDPKTDSIQAVAVAGVEAAVREQELHLGFALANGRTLIVKLPAGAVSGLGMALHHQFQKVAVPSENFALQPLQIAGSRAFSLADGRCGLILDIESFEIPVLFDQADIDYFRNDLDKVEALAKNLRKGQ
jgi:hypothetical protein